MGAYKDTLDIKLTDACNGDCAFCIEKGGKLSDASDVQSFIDKVKGINPRSVLVLGGEPFVYPKLVEFIQGISNREIFITTNGSGLKNKRIVEQLAPCLTALNISLMHYDMVKHTEVTKVVLKPYHIGEAIEILHKYHVSVRINVLLLKGYMDNIEDCKKMIDFAEFLGADDIRFSEVQNQPDMYVDAKLIFKGLNANPYVDGCEQVLSNNKIKVIVKQTCGLVNCNKKDGITVSNTTRANFVNAGVLYPDLLHSPDGWVVKNSDPDCHSTGCHKTTSSGGCSYVPSRSSGGC